MFIKHVFYITSLIKPLKLGTLPHPPTNLQKTLGTCYLLRKYGYTLALRGCWSEYNDKACVLLNCNFFKAWAFLTGLDILHSGYRSGAGVRMKGWSRWVKIQRGDATAAAKSLQSCPTLCDPTDRSPQGPSVHGILQARVLEWVAIAFSERGDELRRILRRKERRGLGC